MKRTLMILSFVAFGAVAIAGITHSSKPQPPNEGGPLPCPPPCSVQ